MPPQDDILRIALDLADGKTVDWKSESDSVPAPLRTAVDNLRAVSDLASVAGHAVAGDAGATTALWGPFEILSEDGTDGFYERLHARDRRTEERGEIRLLSIPTAVSTFERAAAESNAMERLRSLIGLDAEGLITVRRVAYHHGRLGVWCGEQPAPERNDPRTVEPLSVARLLAEAVRPLHQRGIVHGGLRPSVIRFGASGVAVDLPAPCLDPLLSRHLRTWLPWPDAAYLAPELHTSGSASAATDVYGIGAIIYYVLNGRPPSNALGAEEWFAALSDDTMPAPCEGDERRAARYCRKMMQRDPGVRPQTMEDVLELIAKADEAQ